LFLLIFVIEVSRLAFIQQPGANLWVLGKSHATCGA